MMIKLAILCAAATTPIVGLGMVGFDSWSILIGFWIGLITAVTIAYIVELDQ
jgi:hypothetical protein